MAPISFHSLSALFLSFACIQFTYGFNYSDENALDPSLRPLRLRDLYTDPGPPSRALSLLDPVHTDFYLWGNPPPDGSHFYLANMTVSAAKHERLVSVERFESLLDTIECGERIALTFKNKEALQYAQKAWGWLANSKENVFTLVADNPGCAPEGERQVYQVTDAEFNSEKLVVFLDGQAKEWKDALHDMDLQFSWGKVWSELDKRADWTDDFHLPIPFINLNGVIHEDHLSVLRCIDCGVSGRFSVISRFRMEDGSITQASMEMKPEDVRAGMSLEFESKYGAGQGQGPLDITYVKTLARKETPWPRFKIAGIFGVSTVWTAEWLLSISGFEGESSFVQYGAGLRIPDEGSVYANFADSSQNDVSGWGVEFDEERCKAAGKVKGSVATALTFVPALEFNFLAVKFEAGLQLRPFEVTISVDGFATPETTCPEQNKKGTSVLMEAAASVSFRAGINGRTGLGVAQPLLTEPVWEFPVKRGLDGPTPEPDAAAVSLLEARAPPDNPLFGSGAVYLTLVKWIKVLCERCIPPDEPPPVPERPKPPRELGEWECFADSKIGHCVPLGAGCQYGEAFDDDPAICGGYECCTPRKYEFRDPLAETCWSYFAVGKCQDPAEWDCVDGDYSENWQLLRNGECPGSKKCCLTDTV